MGQEQKEIRLIDNMKKDYIELMKRENMTLCYYEATSFS